MTIPWIQAGERAVGANDPSYTDVINRPLRALLTLSGYDPDASPFPGLGPGASVVNATLYAGSTAGRKIQAAVTALAAVGGIIDCRGFASPMVLDVDVCSGLALYSIVPFYFLWGNQEVRVTNRSTPRSHHHHTFYGSRFTLKDAVGARVTGSVFPFIADCRLAVPASGISTTNGSAVVTMATPSDPLWGMVEVGSPVMVLGFVPPLATDDTTINVGGGIDGVTTSITVVSTAAFPSSGFIRIENELVSYTSKDATHFLGCTRGYGGSTAAAHADTTRVDRAVYQPCIVTAVSGSSVTLDVPMNMTATTLPVYLGVQDVRFDGVGDFDGNKNPGVDDASNPQAIWMIGASKVYIGPGLTFRNWDHGGWTLQSCQDCEAFGTGFSLGQPTLALGAGFWVFQWSKRNTIDILAIDGAFNGLMVDDRTTTAQDFDGPSEDSSFRVRRAVNIGNPTSGGGAGLLLDGPRRCYAQIDVFRQVAGSTSVAACHFGGAGQWGTESASGRVCIGNTIVVGVVLGNGGGSEVDISVSAMGNDANTITLTRRNPVGTVQVKNNLTTPSGLRGLTYGVSVATDAMRAEDFTINVTDAVAFTIANPTNPTEQRRITYNISNSSGGAMGAITWGSDFRLSGAFTNPANNQYRQIEFRRVGSQWREQNRTAADQAI